MNHHTSTGHKSDYVVVSSVDGDQSIQIIENGPDHIHWLIVRDKHVEQKIALNFSSLILLCKAVSLHPIFKRTSLEDKSESLK